MKTEGLTFTEAVQALEDGYCEKIQTKYGADFYLNKAGVLSFYGATNDGVKLKPSSFLDCEWKLIGVKQKFVIKDVKWHDCNGFTCPMVHPYFDWSELKNKPKMKVTLEWPE